MIWAIKDGDKVRATPNEKANCPICNSKVISKCGRIKVWHWSHKANKDCDDWYEPESEWHKSWKDEFPKEQQEVTIKKCVSDYCYHEKYNHNHPDEYNHGDCVDCIFIKHRADIKNFNGLIIELQNSNLSYEKIIERELFYNNMVWLLNGLKICKNLQIRKRGKYYSFRWKHPPKSWWNAKKPIYIDLGDKIFQVKKIHNQCPCGGWGYLISREEFLQRFR